MTFTLLWKMGWVFFPCNYDKGGLSSTNQKHYKVCVCVCVCNSVLQVDTEIDRITRWISNIKFNNFNFVIR